MNHEDDVKIQLANAAKAYDWQKMFEILAAHQNLVNSTRPCGSSLYTPLHQAANGNAPEAVVQRLIGMGASLTLETAKTERPVDIALKKGHLHLLPILTPYLKCPNKQMNFTFRTSSHKRRLPAL